MTFCISSSCGALRVPRYAIAKAAAAVLALFAASLVVRGPPPVRFELQDQMRAELEVSPSVMSSLNFWHVSHRITPASPLWPLLLPARPLSIWSSGRYIRLSLPCASSNTLLELLNTSVRLSR